LVQRLTPFCFQILYHLPSNSSKQPYTWWGIKWSQNIRILSSSSLKKKLFTLITCRIYHPGRFCMGHRKLEQPHTKNDYLLSIQLWLCGPFAWIMNWMTFFKLDLF
jgi:hypothetical protein